MNIFKCAILGILLVLSEFATAQIDTGGDILAYAESTIEAKRTGETVIIDYQCESACAIRLSSGWKLQVSKDAKFGIHEIRFVFPPATYSDSKRSKWGTEYFKILMPECAVELFESKQAFDQGKITHFSGEEILKACPQIQEYVE